MRLINIEDVSLLKTVSCGGLSAKALWKRIKEQPIVDAVEVVRCKECRHAYYADNRVPHEKTWVCERFMNEEITSNDFCSWGERKGGEDE